jgi:hypothetical protein
LYIFVIHLIENIIYHALPFVLARFMLCNSRMKRDNTNPNLNTLSSIYYTKRFYNAFFFVFNLSFSRLNKPRQWPEARACWKGQTPAKSIARNGRLYARFWRVQASQNLVAA